MRKYWLQILVLLGLFITLVLIEVYKPKPLNWTPTFAKDDKIPYGNFALYKLLPSLFPDSPISTNTYTFFEASQLLDGQANLLLVSNSLHKLDSIDQSILLEHVAAGGNAFLASERFSASLLDTLNLDLATQYHIFSDSTKIQFNLFNPQLKSDSGYVFPRSSYQAYFSHFDSTQTIALGQLDTLGINYCKIPFGQGNFYMHSQPALFTNFNMVYKNNSEYIAKALSYLPNRKTIWDEYYQYGEERRTHFRYIFQEEALYTAWLTLVFTMLLYVVFMGKRKQRIIPIVAPPRNTSLEFITTIGRLYFHRRDNKDLAIKKFNFLAEHLRSRFYIDIADTKLSDAQQLAQRLGIKAQLIEKLFGQYNLIQTSKQIDADTLLAFANTIEELYNEIKH